MNIFEPDSLTGGINIDPTARMALTLGGNLLAGSAPSPVPRSFGSILGPSIMNTMGAVDAAAQQGLQRKMLATQLSMAQQKMDLINNLLTPRGTSEGAQAPSPLPLAYQQTPENQQAYNQKNNPQSSGTGGVLGALNPQDLGAGMLFPELMPLISKQIPGPSPLASLVNERNRYPVGSTQYNTYDAAINKASGLEPVNVRQGGAVYNPVTHQVDFQNPQLPKGATIDASGHVSMAPGSTNAIAQSEGAEQGQKIVEVKLADGRIVPMKFEDAQRLNLIAPGSSTPQGSSGPLTGLWKTMPKVPTMSGVGQSTYSEKMAGQYADTAGKLTEKYGTLADQANNRKGINNQILDLVDSADTGPHAASQGTVKNYLNKFLNIPESDFQNNPSSTIALQKDLLNAAAQRAKQMFGSRMTQSEIMMYLSKGAPNVDMTKAAIKFLVSSDNLLADYQAQQANDLGKYLDNGGNPMRFEGWYSTTFPLSKAINIKLPDFVKNNVGKNYKGTATQNVPEGIDPALWGVMTPEEQSLWQK